MRCTSSHGAARAALALFSLSSAVLAAGGVAGAQSVWTVDDDGGADFVSIQAAIDAATSGDVVVVADGDYPELVTIAGKGLSVVAEQGASVTLSAVGTTSANEDSGLLVRDLGPAQSVVLRGLTVASVSNFFSPGSHVLLRDCAGPVWIEDCTLGNSSSNVGHDGLTVVDCDDVTLARTTVAPFSAGACDFPGKVPCGNALVASDSDVYVFDCTLQGGDNNLLPFLFELYGGEGARIDGGTLYASGTRIEGGDGGLLDARTCLANGGGAALRLTGGGTLVRLLDSTAEGGAGASDGPGGCPDGDDGADTIVPGGDALDVLSGTARHLVTGSPLLAGDDVQLDYTGVPGDLVYLGYNAGPLGRGFYFPALRGVVLTIGATAPVLEFQGTLDAGGALSVTVPGSSISVSGAFDSYVLQPIFVGGGLTVGTPSQLLIRLP